MYFSLFLRFPLTHQLFRSFLFNFHVLRDFPIVFYYYCFLVIDFLFDSTYIEKHTLNDFSSFKFAEVCVIAQDIVYLGECSIGT